MTRILTLVLLVLTGCATAGGGLTVAAMETYFEEAVFGSTNMIYAWDKPILVYVYGPLPVYEDAAGVIRLAGLTVERVQRYEDANLIIVIRPTYGRLENPNARCETARASRSSGIIDIVVIQAEDGRCIQHEVMHSLGFRGHIYAGPNSALRTGLQRAPLLTDADRLALRVLYDQRLRPGMTPDEARPIVRQILLEKLGG